MVNPEGKSLSIKAGTLKLLHEPLRVSHLGSCMCITYLCMCVCVCVYGKLSELVLTVYFLSSLTRGETFLIRSMFFASLDYVRRWGGRSE